MLAKFVRLEELTSSRLLVHCLREDVEACRCVESDRTGVIGKDFIRLLLAHDAGTNLKVFQHVEEALLRCFQEGSLRDGRAAFELMLEV